MSAAATPVMPNAIREQLPMGVRCERLAASKTHSRFVGGTKAALQKWALEKLHREIPIAAISPRAIAGA
jgi:hypothetical protein